MKKKYTISLTYREHYEVDVIAESDDEAFEKASKDNARPVESSFMGSEIVDAEEIDDI